MKEEDEDEPLTAGAGLNVSTNANLLGSIASGHRHFNTSNRHYSAGLRAANDRRGGYEGLWSEKEHLVQEIESDTTIRHARRQGSRRRSTTDDDRR